MTVSRYDRQLQLAEVGALGQARIAQLVLLTPVECSAPEARSAQLYAERCGMMPTNASLAPASKSAAAAHVTVGYPTHIAGYYRHPASRALGVGAAVALAHVAAALFDQA